MVFVFVNFQTITGSASALPNITFVCTPNKGHPLSADLRYGEDDSISPSTLFFAAIKGLLWIFTLCIPPDVPKKLALR